MYSSALLYRAYRCESTRSGVFQFCFLFFEWTKKKHSNVLGLGIDSRPWLGRLSWMLRVVCVCVRFFVVSHSTSRGQYLSLLSLLLLFCCCFLLDKMIWRFSALSVSDNRASTDMSICICNTDSLHVCVRPRPDAMCYVLNYRLMYVHAHAHGMFSKLFLNKKWHISILGIAIKFTSHFHFCLKMVHLPPILCQYSIPFNCFHSVRW